MSHLLYGSVSDRNFDNDICNQNQTADVSSYSTTTWDSQQSLLAMYVLGKTSQLMTCPSCRSAQQTRIHFENTRQTHIAASLLTPFLFCWCPYVTSTFRVAVHYCSVCGVYIGRSDQHPVKKINRKK